MKPNRCSLQLLAMIGLGLALLPAAASAGRATGSEQQAGRVCPDPARPCPGFRPHDLSFTVPADGVARAESRSAPFYAVIVRSGARCSIPERDRRAVQALFARRKVFSGRFQCDDDIGNDVTYTGVDTRYAFLAIYAGETQAAGNRFLAEVRAGGRFRGANLRRMQAGRVHP